MPKRALTLAVAVLAVLVTAGIVGATSLMHERGHPPASARASAAATDPLDPLRGEEIGTAFKVIEQSRKLANDTFFPLVKLDEPVKNGDAAWAPGRQFPRRAFVDVFDRGANKLYQAIVDLGAKQLVSWTPRPGEQPAVYLSEYEAADSIVHAYAPFKKAMRDRGLDPISSRRTPRSRRSSSATQRPTATG
jgi:Cu2+-containing amine oxidase